MPCRYRQATVPLRVYFGYCQRDARYDAIFAPAKIKIFVLMMFDMPAHDARLTCYASSAARRYAEKSAMPQVLARV